VPIYEYDCGKCGRRTEAIQRMGEAPLRICPHCGARRLKKAISAPAIQFKGTGWYVTDYAASRQAEDRGSDTSDKAEKAEKSEKSEKAPMKADSEKGDKSAKPEKGQKSKERKKPKGDR
jgi:putative FmdB family regulatory protein